MYLSITKHYLIELQKVLEKHANVCGYNAINMQWQHQDKNKECNWNNWKYNCV